MNAGIK
jgi:hypothetical protein